VKSTPHTTRRLKELLRPAVETPASGASTGQRKIKRDEVRYLALEGGGGKGFAYLGAIQVLEELDVIEKIKGFAGASAGAITAFLLSIGYTSKEIMAYLGTADFDSFFDPPNPRTAPLAGIGAKLVEPPESDGEIRLKRLLGTAGNTFRPVLNTALSVLAPGLLAELKAKASKQPFKILAEHWVTYIAYLGRDMGLFSGATARREFDRLIKERMGSALAPDATSITFQNITIISGGPCCSRGRT
jgi:predicted acylesterase/phospholipase RssA